MACVAKKKKKKKGQLEGLPGNPVVKTPHANVEDMGSIPGPGRSHQGNEAHVPQVLSLCSRAQELQQLSPRNNF